MTGVMLKAKTSIRKALTALCMVMVNFKYKCNGVAIL